MSDETTPLPYLDEHEGRDKKAPDTGSYHPSEDDEKLIKKVCEWFRKAKRHKDRYDKKWLDYYKMFRGRQWPDHRPSWKHSDVVNMVFQALQSVMPLETDSRPKFTFLPTEPSDSEVAEIMNEVCESDWENNNWLMTLIEVVVDKYLYGTGLSSMEFDPEENFGAGNIVYKSADPFYCFPDPDATDVNKNAEFFIYAEPLSLSKIKRNQKWKARSRYVTPDSQDNSGAKTDLAPIKLRSNIDQRMIYEEQSPEAYLRNDEALVITCYSYPDDWDEETQETARDDGSVEMTYTQKLRYPNGRKTVMAGNVILEDRPIEYDDGKIPYSRCQNYVLPREFWGISEVEQLEGPQKIFNKLVCMVLDILNLTSNPMLLLDTTSGLDPDNIFNRPGDILEKEPDSQIGWLQPAAINPVFLQMIDRMRDWFDQIVGNQDVSRGTAPSSITAASAIEALQEAAQTRTRQKLRLMDCYLKDAGDQYKARVFQFYDVPRLFRLTSREGLEKYFKMSIQKAPEGNRVVTITPYKKDIDRWAEESPRQFVMRGDLDVRASTGSGLPFQKAQKEQRLIKLFELGAIDQEELLKGMDYPNAALIVERMRAAQPPPSDQGLPPAA